MARKLDTSEGANDERKVEEEALRSPNDASPSKASGNGDQGVMPHTAASAVQIAGDVAQGLKTVVGEAVAWAEAKADKLSAKGEDGTGPYGSMATCAPSDFDAIATGVLPALGQPDKARDDGHDDSDLNKAKDDSNESRRGHDK